MTRIESCNKQVADPQKIIENRPHPFAKPRRSACAMLKIRQEQMDILAQIPKREFLKKWLRMRWSSSPKNLQT